MVKLRGFSFTPFLFIIINIAAAFLTTDSARLLSRSRFSSVNYIRIRSSGDENSDRYAVIFDAGSTGSRVNVFRFDQDFNLLPVGSDLVYFDSIRPGLSAYANDSKAAAASLMQLLTPAEATVPQELRPQTPLRLGATAGLRQLSGDTAERILQAVRELFESESKLKYRAEWVSILNGYQEGSYMWLAINYLLGNLGQEYSNTVGVVDLGGGSVQMAYAISERSAENAPISTSEEDEYVNEMDFKGTNYHLYAHSYLNYGLNAARAKILSLTGNDGNPCVTNGYQGNYTYSGQDYKVSPPPSGTNILKCRNVVKKAFNFDANCPYESCTFNGAWSGGGGAGQKNLYVASYFYDVASWVGIVDPSIKSTKLRPIVYLKEAMAACWINVKEMRAKYPNLEERDVPFLCMDLVYLYTLLVDGFGRPNFKEVTAVKSIEHQGSMIGAAWPLGCALHTLSSTSPNANWLV